MDTFFSDGELARLGDLDRRERLVARRLGRILDLLNNVVAFDNLAEDDVTAVEPAAIWTCVRGIACGNIQGHDSRSFLHSDEELRAIGVGSGVRHAEETLFGVLELEVFVWELDTINCTSQ